MAKKPKTKLRVGDLVRVKQSGGRLSDQRYKVAKVGLRCYCEITQWPASGANPAKEPFDTSLLAVDNAGPAMLSQMLGSALFGGGRRHD